MPQTDGQARMKTQILALPAAAFLAFAAAYAGTNEDLTFAIGLCSAQPDTAVRLACYDKIAARLKAGMPVTEIRPPARMAAVPAAVPPAQQMVPAYTPPPGYAPAARAPAPPVAAPAPAPAYVPPAAQAPKQEDSAWYDPTGWFGSDEKAAAPGNPANFGAERIPEGQAVAGEPPKPRPVNNVTASVTAVSYSANGRFIVTLDNGQVWRQIDGDSTVARFENNKHYIVTISRGLIGSYNLVIKGQTALFKVKRVK
jgi:hypothetical protein